MSGILTDALHGVWPTQEPKSRPSDGAMSEFLKVAVASMGGVGVYLSVPLTAKSPGNG